MGIRDGLPLGMGWHDYNESLIERGSSLMDLGFLNTWHDEVEVMNEGKEGRPYRFPESYVSFLAFLKVGFDMTFRELQGVTRALSEHIKPLEEMHFTHARRRIIRMVKKRKVVKAYADGAYDSRRNFDVLDELSIEPAIKVKRNASAKPHGSPLRKEEVMLVHKLGYDRWKEMKDYGRRWLVEVVFSSLKGVLGETLRAKTFASQKVEASLKVMLYNAFMSIRP